MRYWIMSFEEFKSTIVNSRPQNWLYDDEFGKYIYLNDISISITADRCEESFNEEFYESWVTNYSDKKATKQIFFLNYNGDMIEPFFTASVDGGRSYIPFPDRKDMTITSEQYSIGKIVNILLNEIGFNFDSYLSEAGITVK